MTKGDVGAVAELCRAVEPHPARYLLAGGFPEPALLDDPTALELRPIDVVDRVRKRDMVALFQMRSGLESERMDVFPARRSSTGNPCHAMFARSRRPWTTT